MENLTDIWKTGREIWPTRQGLLFALLTAAAVLLPIFIASDLSTITFGEWGIFIAILAIIIMVWYVTSSIPRAHRGRVGFGVAIEFESEDHAKAVESDLLRRLRELLSRNNGMYAFEIVECPPRISRKLDTNAAAELLQRSNCRFLIYGIGRIRSQDDKPTHVFDLAGIVSHAPLPNSVSKQFAQEFASVFPSKLLLPIERDVFAFEFTAQWIDVVVRYIVGVAAYYTADLKYAEELLLQVESQLDNDTPRLPAIAKIKQRTPSRIRDIYRSAAYSYGNMYRISRDKEMLKNAEQALDKLEARCSTDYRGHLLRAMISFALHRDSSSIRHAH